MKPEAKAMLFQPSALKPDCWLRFAAGIVLAGVGLMLVVFAVWK